MRTWSISAGRDGYKAELVEVPAWALGVERLSEAVYGLTRHRLCCDIPDVFWKTPLGRARRDADGDLDNSIGGAAWSFSQKLLGFSYQRETCRYSHSVSREFARSIEPEFVDQHEELMADD